MTDQKRLVVLADDNWADYFPFTRPKAIIKGAPIPDDRFEPDGPQATRLIGWVGKQESDEATYTLTPHDAAVVLNLVAGCNPPKAMKVSARSRDELLSSVRSEASQIQ